MRARPPRRRAAPISGPAPGSGSRPVAGGGPRGSAHRVLPAMKRLIDDGYVLPFAAAMALERERSQAHRARVTGEAVAGRVDAVVSAGQGAVRAD